MDSLCAFLGLDLSLSSTGVAMRFEMEGKPLAYSESLCPPKNMIGAPRLAWLENELRNLLERWDRRTACTFFYATIEGYAMAGSGRITGLAEWGGVVRLLLHRLQIPVLCIAPSSLKLWMAGHGFADKPMMRRAVLRMGAHYKWRMPRPPEGSDEIDALALAEAGRWRMEGADPRYPMEDRAKRFASLYKAAWETGEGKAGKGRKAAKPARPAGRGRRGKR